MLGATRILRPREAGLTSVLPFPVLPYESQPENSSYLRVFAPSWDSFGSKQQNHEQCVIIGQNATQLAHAKFQLEFHPI